MKYLTKDEDNRWMIFNDKPKLTIPIIGKIPMFWDSIGEAESITEQKALEILSKIPIMIEIED
jgi:hypothetical protein